MDSVSIETKVLTGFGAVLLVLAAIAALTYQSFRSFIDAFGAVEHTLQVRVTLQQVQGRLIDAQTGTRGYLITGDERYLSPYQSALATLDQDVQRLGALTATNPDQQRRIGELHDRVAPLLASFDRLIALRREQGFEAAREQLVNDAGGRRMAAIRELIAAMDAEEARLLQQRTAASQDSADELTLALELLIGVSVLFFALLLWRVRRDLLSRRRAEEDLAEVARYDRVIGEALALFNASPERGRVLDGVLSLLADTSLYPVSVFYRYDSWSGMLEREAGWGTSAGTATSYRLGEGLVGQAAQARRVLVLDAAAGLPTIDAGVQSLRPAAILVVPVAYQERLLGVLVLASTRAAGARDRTFVERLAAQIGVALHNLQQFADVRALAGELRQRGEEITRKNRELEAANRMKSEFLATMSHELRTPLNAIIGFSEVLKDGLAGELNPEQRDYVGDIFDSGHHLLALINDILDLSKVEAGAMPLELEAVDVAQWLRNGLAMVREKALAHGLQVDLRIADGVGVIGADARKCKQILYNLLSNAVKFTPRGGRLELTAQRMARAAIESAGAGEAHVRWLPPAGPYDEFLEIGVADTGIGLSQAELDRLFRPFVQIDSSLARKYAGTGLGLVMVKSLLELHGGGVGVSSTPGRGSRFTVWLPCRAPADTEAVIAPASVRNGGEALALVIEDDDQSAELIRLQLEAEGFAVVRATSGEEGLALATARLPDLITLDLLLPGMDGWACLERLRDDPTLAQVPVVIISILADDARARGLSLGVARVLQKPVGRQALQEAMVVLGLSQLADPPPSVLVVDDDPRSVEIIATYLEEAGFVVMQAYGGRDGIDLAQNTHPALVVLDLMMPEINGFEVVEVLKRRPETADIPILVVTAKQIDAEERARLNGHLLRVVEKAAFSPEDFIREVRRSLRRAANAA